MNDQQIEAAIDSLVEKASPELLKFTRQLRKWVGGDPGQIGGLYGDKHLHYNLSFDEAKAALEAQFGQPDAQHKNLHNWGPSVEWRNVEDQFQVRLYPKFVAFTDLPEFGADTHPPANIGGTIRKAMANPHRR